MFRKLVLPLFFFLPFVLRAQNAEQVAANYIAFTGGAANWHKVHSIASSGTYNYGGVSFPFEAWSKAPNLYKYIVRNKGKYFAQAYDGKKGWRIDVFNGEKTKTILTGEAARAMANEADVELENPFVNYTQKGFEVISEGKDTIDNIACYKLKIIRRNADTTTWFFSTADYSLVKKQAVSKNEQLNHALLDIYYSDYRMVQGIKLPFKTVCKADGQTILTILVSNARLNVPVPDKEFKP